MRQYLAIVLTLLLLAGGATARAQATNTNAETNQVIGPSVNYTKSEEPSTNSEASRDPFEVIRRNNIFDESRVGRRRPGSIGPTIPVARVQTITFCGTVMDDGGAAAFFRGNGARDRFLKPGDFIDDLKVARITADSVTLTNFNDDAPANSNGGTPTNSASNTLAHGGTNGLTNAGSNTPTNTSGSTLTGSASGTPTDSSSNALAVYSSSNIFVLDLENHPTLRREGYGPWHLSGYVPPEPATGTNSTATNLSATASSGGPDDVIARLKKKREEQ